MMDIESNRYRIRSTIGGFNITDLRTKETRLVSKAPDARTLAAISESQFDVKMQELFNQQS